MADIEDGVKSACFTGHRRLPKGDLLPFASRLLDTVLALAKKGITNFKNGGAIGFDHVGQWLY